MDVTCVAGITNKLFMLAKFIYDIWGITNKLFMLAKFIYGVWFVYIVYKLWNMNRHATGAKALHSVWHSFDSL